MTDEPDDLDVGTPSAPRPRWVKVFFVIAVVAVVLLVIMIAGGHGPGRHM